MKKKGILVFCLYFVLSACSTEKTRPGIIPGLPPPALALIPKAKLYRGDNVPIVQTIFPSGPADHGGIKAGDIILKLNGEFVSTADQFEEKIKRAPPQSIITFRRNGRIFTKAVSLGSVRPRFGARFEPNGTALLKMNRPFIDVMYNKEITAFAETSVNEEHTRLNVNLILTSLKPFPVARIKYGVYDRGLKKRIGSGQSFINALGSEGQLFKKAFYREKGFKGPFAINIAVDGKQFHFEFQ